MCIHARCVSYLLSQHAQLFLDMCEIILEKKEFGAIKYCITRTIINIKMYIYYIIWFFNTININIMNKVVFFVINNIL